MVGNAPSASKIIQEKMKNTCIERYGVDNSTKSKIVQEKMKNTCIERYGVDNIFKSEKVKQLNTKMQLKKGYQTILKLKDYVIPLFTLDEYKGGKDNIYKWKCVKCGNEFEQKIYTSYFNNEFPSLPRCLNCYPLGTNTSFKELELLEFCKKYFLKAEKSKTLISPFELDIIIPEIKLALEFNGLYFHSLNSDKGVSLSYHLNKVIKCNEKGYRLIHIWEDEWDNNKEEIKKRLIDIFEGKEVIDYSKPLDRSWYNNLEGEFEELPPEIIIRNGFEVENCGYLIKKNNRFHAEEDKKFKEEQSILNGADSLIFNLEKTMKENDEKIPVDLKTSINSKLDELKKAKEEKNIEKIKSIQESLQQEMQKIGEAIYKAQQEAQSAQTQQQTENQTQQNADGTVDAEVVE